MPDYDIDSFVKIFDTANSRGEFGKMEEVRNEVFSIVLGHRQAGEHKEADAVLKVMNYMNYNIGLIMDRQ